MSYEIVHIQVSSLIECVDGFHENAEADQDARDAVSWRRTQHGYIFNDIEHIVGKTSWIDIIKIDSRKTINTENGIYLDKGDILDRQFYCSCQRGKRICDNNEVAFNITRNKNCSISNYNNTPFLNYDPTIISEPRAKAPIYMKHGDVEDTLYLSHTNPSQQMRQSTTIQELRICVDERKYF